ncbi:TPA: hypothetical protein ACU8BQ_002035 [Neisseria subflava]
MSSKAKVLCSLCTNTIFSDTYFQHKNRFFKSDWDKKGNGAEKQPITSLIFEENRKKSLSDGLITGKKAQKKLPEQLWGMAVPTA